MKREGIETHTGVASLNFKHRDYGELTKQRAEKAARTFLGHCLWGVPESQCLQACIL